MMTRKRVFLVVLTIAVLALLSVPLVMAQGQGQGRGRTEVTTIRGKVMGFASVSPALQAEIEARYGRRPRPDPNSRGPNAQVGRHGFAYVSPEAEKKNK